MMDNEERFYQTLKGKFKHYCPDWDFMAIDEMMPEFEHCLCEFPDLTTHTRGRG